MTARLQFQPSVWPTLAAAAGIALTSALGMWQLGRGHEKAALAARVEQLAHEPAISVSEQELNARDVELRRVEARGVFEPKYMVLLDNRVRHGVVGYHVVMPLKLGDGSRYVLVNRGWVAGSPDRSRLPEVKTPPETLVVRGRAVVPSRRFLELSTQVAEGRVWQNLTLERYREAMPIAIQPFLIQQENDGAPDDGLIREWAPPDLGVDRHYGYAFQWFALSALILVLYLITHVRRDRET
ncbi:MAG TPA: SURF1 family protein [Burkholderiales bacterium]|nr:SURF1 family protein [Burkholderiales bacterium]